MQEKPEYLPYLISITEFEEETTRAWEWDHVRVPPHVIRVLLEQGIVYKASKRMRKTRNLQAVKDAIKQLTGGEDERANSESEGTDQIEIPDNLFDVLVGYEDIKDTMRMAIAANNAGEPVHVLLEGVPASGKSVFLMEIERLPKSIFVTAGTSTKVGLRDILAANRPRFLLIDEIEKIDDPNNLSVLLTLMESQRLIAVKHMMHLDVTMNTTVIAACNSTKRLPAELVDRFWHLYLEEYTPEEFRQVAINVLTMREGIDTDLAEYITDRVLSDLKSTSVRDCVKIARMAKTMKGQEKKAVDVLIHTKQRRSR